VAVAGLGRGQPSVGLRTGGQFSRRHLELTREVGAFRSCTAALACAPTPVPYSLEAGPPRVHVEEVQVRGSRRMSREFTVPWASPIPGPLKRDGRAGPATPAGSGQCAARVTG